MTVIKIPNNLIEKLRDSSKGQNNTVGYLFLNPQTQKVMGFYMMYTDAVASIDADKETIVHAVSTDHKFELVGYHTKYSKGELASIRASGIPDYKHVYISQNFIGPLTRNLEVMTFVPGMDELIVMNDLEKELVDLETRLDIKVHQAGS